MIYIYRYIRVEKNLDIYIYIRIDVFVCNISHIDLLSRFRIYYPACPDTLPTHPSLTSQVPFFHYSLGMLLVLVGVSSSRL